MNISLYGCFRMPRKFRLAVHRKNEDRKKRALRVLCSPKCSAVTLPVSLPIASYFEASTVTLLERIKKVPVLPQGISLIIIVLH